MFGSTRQERYRQSLYERKARRAQQAGLNTGCIFVLLVLTLSGWHIYELSRIVESASWRKTTGRVVASSSEPGTFVSFITYANVVYAYTVKKFGYSSQNLRWGSGYRLTRAGAAAEAARYPVGAEVEVYYDPDAPSDAVLERGFNRH